MASGKKTGGRVKGSPNKLGGEAKDNIAAVFVRLGGTANMAKWAEENQSSFYQLYAKLLPLKLANEEGESFRLSVIENIIIDPKDDEVKG